LSYKHPDPSQRAASRHRWIYETAEISGRISSTYAAWSPSSRSIRVFSPASRS